MLTINLSKKQPKMYGVFDAKTVVITLYILLILIVKGSFYTANHTKHNTPLIAANLHLPRNTLFTTIPLQSIAHCPTIQIS